MPPYSGPIPPREEKRYAAGDQVIFTEKTPVITTQPPLAQPSLPGGSTPSQYSLPVGATELQDLIEYRNMNFAVGNIFKASYRLGHCDHSDPARDLRKIIFFAQRELERITKQPEEEV